MTAATIASRGRGGAAALAPGLVTHRAASRVIEGMTARMQNPANLLPDSMKGIQSIIKATHGAGVPRSTMELAHLRASQINGCSPCVYSGSSAPRRRERATNGSLPWLPGVRRTFLPTRKERPWPWPSR